MKKACSLLLGIVGALGGAIVAVGQQATSNAVASLPAVVVRADADREEQKIGPYAQPEWTTHRRFSTTRVYLQDEPWEMEFEQWWRFQSFRNGDTAHLFQEELTIGLPHRMQFDLYDNWAIPEHGSAYQDSIATELRYAFADWGVIPLNPTVYLEYKFGANRADAAEAKLLLGAELAPKWHWGANIFVEQELWDGQATELGASQGFSYSLYDRRLNVGVEMQYEQASERGERDKPSREFLIGPSFQWRPVPRVHVDVVPLFGVTHDAPRVEAFLVVGYDFGTLASEGYKPKSLGN